MQRSTLYDELRVLIMKRCLSLASGIILILGSQAVLAQHRGSHGAGASGAPGAPPVSDDLKQFDAAVALQASPEQVHQFTEWAKDTVLARKYAQDLLATNKSGSSFNTVPLTDATDDLATDQERFVGGFTPTQKAGLKEMSKKVGKAGSEVARSSRAIRASSIDPSQLASAVAKLDKALEELQTHQSAIAGAMGIKSGENSQ
jgi:hypothetical protein